MISVHFRKNKIKNFIIVVLLIVIFFLLGKTRANAQGNPYIDLDYTFFSEYIEKFPYEETISYLHEKLDDQFDWIYYLNYRNDNNSRLMLTSLLVFDKKMNPKFDYLGNKLDKTTKKPNFLVIGSNSKDSSNYKYASFILNWQTDSLSTIKNNIDKIYSDALNGLHSNYPSFNFYGDFHTIDGNNYIRDLQANSSQYFLIESSYDLYNKQPYYGNNEISEFVYDYKIENKFYGQNEKVPTWYEWKKAKEIPQYTADIKQENMKTTVTIQFENFDKSKYTALVCDSVATMCYDLDKNFKFENTYYNTTNLKITVWDRQKEVYVVEDDLQVNVGTINNPDSPNVDIFNEQKGKFDFQFKNVPENSTCQFGFLGEDLKNVNCSGVNSATYSTNTVGIFKIYKNGELIFDYSRGFVFSFDLPYFRINQTNFQNYVEVNIYTYNFSENDILQVSSDLQNWTTYPLQMQTKIPYYFSQRIYVRLLDNAQNLKASDTYYVYVDFNSTNNDVDNAKNLFGALNNLQINSSITGYISTIYNSILSTQIGNLIFYSFIGLAIALLCYLVKRK